MPHLVPTLRVVMRLYSTHRCPAQEYDAEWKYQPPRRSMGASVVCFSAYTTRFHSHLVPTLCILLLVPTLCILLLVPTLCILLLVPTLCVVMRLYSTHRCPAQEYDAEWKYQPPRRSMGASVVFSSAYTTRFHSHLVPTLCILLLVPTLRVVMRLCSTHRCTRAGVRCRVEISAPTQEHGG